MHITNESDLNDSNLSLCTFTTTDDLEIMPNPYLRTILSLARYCKYSCISRIEMRRWIIENAKRSTIIDPSIELSGVAFPFDQIAIGDRGCVAKDVSIYFSDKNSRLEIGSDCYIGRNCMIGVYAPLNLGSYVMVAPYCYITTANHSFDKRDIPMLKQSMRAAPVVIEDDVWIGTRVVVLPGVTVGKGAVVAAGSVVNRDIPAYEIWGGTPARFLKHRPK